MRRLILAIFTLFAISASAQRQQRDNGYIYAADFADWSVPGQAPTTGDMVFQPAAACKVTSAGYAFNAFKVGTPIKIVDANPLNNEVVIPTAVRIGPTTCTVSTTMTHPHSSYIAQSGTAGLQEAINQAGGLNPSLVVITPAWALAGGTTGMIPPANGNYATSILDERSSVILPYLWNGTVYVPQPFAGGGPFAPLNNPTGGQNNYAPLVTPSFTGPVTSTLTSNSLFPYVAYNYATGTNGTGIGILTGLSPNLMVGANVGFLVGTSPANGNNFVLQFRNHGTDSPLNSMWLGIGDIGSTIRGLCSNATGNVGIGYRNIDDCPTGSALTVNGDVFATTMHSGGTGSTNVVCTAANGLCGAGPGGGITSVTTSNSSLLSVANGTTAPVLTVLAAPKWLTARNINGVAVDGTADVTVPAAAGTLTGSTLAAGVGTASLNSITPSAGTFRVNLAGNTNILAIRNNSLGQDVAYFTALGGANFSAPVVSAGTEVIATGTATSFTNYPSNVMQWDYNFWTGSASAVGTVQSQVTLGTGANPSVTLNFTKPSGSSGTFQLAVGGSVVCTVANPCGGGSSGFPFNLGSTAITAGGTFSSVAGLTVNGVTLDATGANTQYLNRAGTYTTPPGSGGSPASPNLSAQYNNGGSFGALPLATDSTGKMLTATGGNLLLNAGGTSTFSSTICLPTSVTNIGISSNPAVNCTGSLFSTTMSGYNLGPTPVVGSGNGWLNSIVDSSTSYMRSAGIKGFHVIEMHCSGLGDCNRDSINQYTRNGIAYSDEGAGSQLHIQEDVQPEGVILAGGGGNGVQTITTNAAGNAPNGVGHVIFHQTYDVLNTTITYASQTSTYATYNTSSAVPASVACSTVVSDVPMPAKEANVFTTMTINLNTPTSLSGTVGMLFAVLQPLPQVGKVISVGTLSGGQQTITVKINKSILGGSRYCIGGLAGRILESTTWTNQKKYTFFIIGSPTTTSFDTGDMSSNRGVQGNGRLSGVANIYHSAWITGMDATASIFTLTENDVHWDDNTYWTSPNDPYGNYYFANETILTDSPFAEVQGHEYNMGGAFYPPADAKWQVFHNQFNPLNYIGHPSHPAGKTFIAPIVSVIQGEHGIGDFWYGGPQSAGYPDGSNTLIPGAISMGPLDADIPGRDWIIASDRAHYDYLFYNAETRQFGINTLSSGGGSGFLINNSLACTVANGLCGSSSTPTLTTLAAATTITPTSLSVLITGTGSISTITPPTGCSTAGTSCKLTILEAQGSNFTLSVDGNIINSYPSVPGSSINLAYNPGTSLWYPAAYVSGTGGGSVSNVSGTTANGFAVSTTSPTTTPVISVAADGTHYLPTTTDQTNWNGKQAAGNYITALTGDVTAAGPGSAAATVTRINGISLAGLSTGLLKNTTTSGVPSIAVAGTDYALPNANTTGQSGTTNTIAGNVTFSTGLSTTGAGTIANPYVVTVSGSAPSFASLTGGTNTGASMLVGSGASLGPTGTGTIDASTLLTGTWASPGAIGATAANTGNFTNLTVNATGTTGATVIQGFTPSMATGQENYMTLGVANTTRNSALIGFSYAGNGSTSNRMDIGFGGTANQISINGSGNVGIGVVNSAGTYKFLVSGGIGSTGMVNTQTTYQTTIGTTIASAATIAPVTSLFSISGTATITTITIPTGFSGTIGGCLDILATGNWAVATGGNISAAFTAVSGTHYRPCYFGTSWTF